MRQTITLNVSPYLSDEQWAKVTEVYHSMDGWIADASSPSWYGTINEAKHISVSAEPSGLVFVGNIEADLWTGWVSVICARLTVALNVPVHDADM